MQAHELADRLLIGGLLGFGGFISLTNWLALIPRSSGHQPSLVPVFGGALVLWGMGISETLRPWWWTSFLVDWTMLPTLFWWGPRIAVESWKFSEYNIVHRFESVNPPRPEKVVLYRSGFGVATVPARISDDPQLPGNPCIGVGGEWTVDRDTFEFTRNSDGYRFRLIADDGTFRVDETQNTIADHSLHDLRLRKSK